MPDNPRDPLVQIVDACKASAGSPEDQLLLLSTAWLVLGESLRRSAPDELVERSRQGKLLHRMLELTRDGSTSSLPISRGGDDSDWEA